MFDIRQHVEYSGAGDQNLSHLEKGESDGGHYNLGGELQRLCRGWLNMQGCIDYCSGTFVSASARHLLLANET